MSIFVVNLSTVCSAVPRSAGRGVDYFTVGLNKGALIIELSYKLRLKHFGTTHLTHTSEQHYIMYGTSLACGSSAGLLFDTIFQVGSPNTQENVNQHFYFSALVARWEKDCFTIEKSTVRIPLAAYMHVFNFQVTCPFVHV